ncbi:MAG: response regulator transcription factor [Desulfovibrio sp.]|nr:response regulator transcription factor [Desulfovibrio sp.]
MPHILLVEDDEDLAAAIIDYLELESLTCDYARTGLEGLNLAVSAASVQPFDAIILDLNLPGMDGLNVCKQLRSQGMDTPVLMLTALDQLKDKLAGFAAGTDDYLVKPFAMPELVARLRVLVLRRSGQVSVLRCDDLEMDVKAHTVLRQGHVLHLRPIEWKILHVLLRHSPDVVSRQELLIEVWGDNPPDSNSLKVHLFHLRKSIDEPFTTHLLHTLPGQGIALRRED